MQVYTLKRFSQKYLVLSLHYDFSPVGANFTDDVRIVNAFCNAERVLVFVYRLESPLDSSRAQFRVISIAIN